MTTYLTIDSSGAHGNNGYKTAKEDLLWSGNGYKKAFAAERSFTALFGMWMSRVRVTSLRPKIPLKMGKRFLWKQEALFILISNHPIDKIHLLPVILLMVSLDKEQMVLQSLSITF